MTWHVQYSANGEDRVSQHPTPEMAIETACDLIDSGHEVKGIGTGELTDSIGVEQIAKIYSIRNRTRPR
jgi:hypothetical protein